MELCYNNNNNILVTSLSIALTSTSTWSIMLVQLTPVFVFLYNFFILHTGSASNVNNVQGDNLNKDL